MILASHGFRFKAKTTKDVGYVHKLAGAKKF